AARCTHNTTPSRISVGTNSKETGMTVINWPKDIGLLELKIRPHADLILTGTVLAVDPSSGSRDSQPGWAFFSEGEYLMGGTLKINHKNDIYQRLIDLYKGLNTLTDTTPDVMVIEKIHK